jgi:hypothetical protein
MMGCQRVPTHQVRQQQQQLLLLLLVVVLSRRAAASWVFCFAVFQAALAAVEQHCQQQRHQ